MSPQLRLNRTASEFPDPSGSSGFDDGSGADSGAGGESSGDGFGAGLEGGGAASGTTEGARPKRKRRRGGRRRTKSTGDEQSTDGDEGSAEDSQGDSARGDSTADEPKSERAPKARARKVRAPRKTAARSSEDDAEVAQDSPRAKADSEGGATEGRAGEDGATEGRDGEDGGEERAPRRRRRSRRKSSKSLAKPEDDGESPSVEAESAESQPGRSVREDQNDGSEDGEDEPKKRRRRGSRGGRKHKKKAGGRGKSGAASEAVDIELLPGEDDDLPELAELPADTERVDEGEGKPKRSRRSKKSKKAKSTRQEPEAEESGGGKKRKKRKRRGRGAASDRDDDDLDEPAPKVVKPRDRKILVNAVDPEETRVIVIEDGRISDLQMTVKKHVSYVSDIYRGRVVNLEPAIGAAFVDFGQGRNGFLHASDVLPSYGDDDWQLENLLHTPTQDDDDSSSSDDSDGEDSAEGSKSKKKASKRKARSSGGRQRRPRMPIEKLIKKGQMVAVQITKDAIGDKGPTLTTYVSIPGRYLVLMPSLERTGVSRKIEDERERRRLKRILAGLEIPDGMGVIVRTAGVGKTKDDIQRDLDYLLLAWGDFSRRLKSGRNPAPLYEESDVAIRTMRDLYTSDTEKVIVDDDEVYERVIDFTKKLMPEHVARIHRHDTPRPLFNAHGIEQDFEKIFTRRVELPSGGSIVIDQTEALVAIDVNSGRTREKGADFEDIALKTNLEAAPEIARQIRLRDLGGIIVLDYIDMMRMNSRRKVEKATRDALIDDRARSKIGRISQFGLLELTRQRLGPGLSKLVYETCATCRGTGRRRSIASRAQAILRRLGTALLLKGFTTVEVRAHPEVIEYLKSTLNREMESLSDDSGRKLVLMGVPEQVEDSVLHYLRADGREVRPGGRRKR